ncbi:poly-gamma-glutamate system protein [Fusobacterium sp.]|uniref:poly-gamma-glutamate system protein n=1 Tax=Fusobacterium sp. TaxID=68766 RepID=UPI00290367F4|nr:poly-gamma-glutamate system protein [Fusobacterium sp.]MDU1911153.1 poly-gamma-glutamate system protein [Fusobacterium sp.]
MNKKTNNVILTVIALLFIFIQYGLKNKEIKTKSPYYNEMTQASEKMKTMSIEIKNERIRKGIAIDKNLDINETGLIGEEWSRITTTLGNLESKRTSTNPDFAALMVKLFKEKGLKKGDIIAANLSSSFPALNLSLIAAADTLELNAIMVNSVGASTYGGNIEDFTYLDMENYLFSKEIIQNRSRGFSLGGIGDIGKEFEEEIKEKIIEKNKKYGLKFFYNENLEENIEERYNYFVQESNNQIKAFINIGGNLLSIGDSVDIIVNSKIILDENTNMKRGLIGKFLKDRIPVFYLLNLKGITAAYNLPFDQYNLQDTEKNNIFFEKNISIWNYLIIGIFLIFVLKMIFMKKK